MNKYIIPVYDSGAVFNMVIIAKSFEDCQEKIMDEYPDYNEDDYDYKSFKKAAKEDGVIIGKIMDIEEL